MMASVYTLAVHYIEDIHSSLCKDDDIREDLFSFSEMFSSLVMPSTDTNEDE